MEQMTFSDVVESEPVAGSRERTKFVGLARTTEGVRVDVPAGVHEVATVQHPWKGGWLVILHVPDGNGR